MQIKVNSLKETENLAKLFAECLDEKGIFATLTGDIGAGKTCFIRYVLKHLNITQNITSPSFVILNEYKSEKFPIYHFDLYRLEEKGLKSIIPELREYSKPNTLTFIEWAEFGQDEIPQGALKINVQYNEENLDIREFSFESEDEICKKFIEKLKDKVSL